MCTLIMYTLYVILNKGLLKDAMKFALLINILIMQILVVSYYIFDRSSKNLYHNSKDILINVLKLCKKIRCIVLLNFGIEYITGLKWIKIIIRVKEFYYCNLVQT